MARGRRMGIIARDGLRAALRPASSRGSPVIAFTADRAAMTVGIHCGGRDGEQDFRP